MIQKVSPVQISWQEISHLLLTNPFLTVPLFCCYFGGRECYTKIIRMLLIRKYKLTVCSSLAFKSKKMGQPYRLNGVGRNGFQKPDKPLDCGNSGTTMRLLGGIVGRRRS
jgi:hypothetical protein